MRTTIFERVTAKAVFRGVLVSAMLTLGFGAAAAHADTITIGALSYDEGAVAPNIATFDIFGVTGSENALSPDLVPVSTAVDLSSLSLVVTFLDHTTQTFGSSDFTLGGDGVSYDGPGVTFGTPNDAVSATLTGTFSTTSLTMTDATTRTILDSFSTTLSDPAAGTLQNLDYAPILATTVTPGGTPVPEPEPLGLFAIGLLMAGLAAARGRDRRRLLAGACLLLGAASASAATTVLVQTATATFPFTGLTGVSKVNISVKGLPSGATAAGMRVYVAPNSCMAPGGATTSPNLVKTMFGGKIGEVNFTIPAGLVQGTYYVSLSGTATGGVSYASSGCALVSVTATNSTVAACVPTSSLAVAMGTTVTAYVPNGYWGGGTTGVEAVPIEGGGAPVAISTPSSVNSCASNPANGETVCTANTTDVYLIKGTGLVATLTSGADTYASFTGGSCQNCGVAINALTNTAYIAGGFTGGGGSNQGVQPLDLLTNTFGAPFSMQHNVSEDIAIDGTRNLLLSPGEDGSYTVLTLDRSGGIVSEFGNNAPAYTDLDSAAEDCTTGIALAAEEFSSNVYIVDLSQAAYTPGVPAGTWTAPGQTLNVAGFSGSGGFSAGTSGISVAPGTGHLGIVTGEFGGNTASVLQLPSTSGTGTPGLVDFAYFTLPSTPDGQSFSAGNDPHTTTAYTSPNNGKAYGVIADWQYAAGDSYVFGPTYLAIIDLQALLKAPRTAANTVDPTYNLVTNGVIRYVPTH